MEKNATPPPAKPPQSDPHTVRRKQRQFRFRRHARRPLSARARALRWRRVGVVVLFLMGVAAWLIANPASWQTEIIYDSEASESTPQAATNADGEYYASYLLAQLTVADAADGSTYEREEQFYSNWLSIKGCSLRQRIIKRDFTTATLDTDNCTVIAGLYTDPYSGEEFEFHERSEISRDVQIDHVVALSNAWQTGAQNLSADARYALATDPLNLVAASSAANQAAMIAVLTDCPAQTVTGIETEKVSASTLSAFASISVKELPHASR